MNLLDYSIKVRELYPNRGNNLRYVLHGLSGECGEVNEKIKKSIREGIDLSSGDDFAWKLGDYSWYLDAFMLEKKWEWPEIDVNKIIVFGGSTSDLGIKLHVITTKLLGRCNEEHVLGALGVWASLAASEGFLPTVILDMNYKKLVVLGEP